MDVKERDSHNGFSSYDEILDFEFSTLEDEMEEDSIQSSEDSFYRPLEEY